MPRIATIPLFALVVGLFACGGHDLSRGKAGKAIEERLNKKKDFPTVSYGLGSRHYAPPEGAYDVNTICPSLLKDGHPLRGGFVPAKDPGGRWTNWGAAIKAGFVSVKGEMFYYRDFGQNKSAIKCTTELSDKGRPYVVTENDFWSGTIFRVVESVEVKVTGVSKPLEAFGQTIAEAEYSRTYRFNPLGQALAGAKSAPDERSGRALFRLFDDGWRLEGGE